jgi:protein-S-isoprenylcysteine O-methyltransferase Ste14
MRGKIMIALKTSLFMIFVPLLLMGIFPIWLMNSQPALFSFGPLRRLALPLWGLGTSMAIWCARAFTVVGHGTPSPADPPKELVVSGLYRFVRNPIYVGALLILLGHVFWHPSPSILWMPLIVAVCAHLFVILYEEPHLRKTFGASYEQYCQSVRRWIPRLK